MDTFMPYVQTRLKSRHHNTVGMITYVDKDYKRL